MAPKRPYALAMIRHPHFQPLSLDHFTALLLARSLRSLEDDAPVDAALRAVQNAWDTYLERHIAEEDRELPALIPPTMLARMRGDHAELRARIATLAVKRTDVAGSLRTFGQLLHDHVRWEEREVFPAAEKSLIAMELS